MGKKAGISTWAAKLHLKAALLSWYNDHLLAASHPLANSSHRLTSASAMKRGAPHTAGLQSRPHLMVS